MSDTSPYYTFTWLKYSPPPPPPRLPPPARELVCNSCMRIIRIETHYQRNPNFCPLPHVPFWMCIELFQKYGNNLLNSWWSQWIEMNFNLLDTVIQEPSVRLGFCRLLEKQVSIGSTSTQNITAYRDHGISWLILFKYRTIDPCNRYNENETFYRFDERYSCEKKMMTKC